MKYLLLLFLFVGCVTEEDIAIETARRERFKNKCDKIAEVLRLNRSIVDFKADNGYVCYANNGIEEYLKTFENKPNDDYVVVIEEEDIDTFLAVIQHYCDRNKCDVRFE